MQNSHFYFCTLDAVGISFLKSGGFARDILTKLKSTLSDALQHENLMIFNFDYPSLAKSQFLDPNGGQDGVQMKFKSDFHSD